jgi:hypothetical protein
VNVISLDVKEGALTLARTLMALGAGLLAVGALVWLGGRLHLPLGRLPGDIRIERENFRFYFPLTTCLLISVLVSLAVWMFRKR